MDSNSEDSDDQKLPDPEEVMEAKRANPGMFVSAWEADEQDINPWTDAQIKSDPAKMFIVAAEQGNAMTLELIASSASHDDGPSLSDLVTATDCDGYTALHRAVYNGHCKVAEMLLDMGANVNHRTNDGWTPLHSAAFWNKLSCVQALMTAGADITAVTNGQQTVLHLAVSNGQSCETLLFLLSHPDAPLWVKNGAGDSVKDLILRNTPYADLTHLLSRAANCPE